ncbi:MAG: excinuclease ABC subunit UvrC, partial [Bacilli bacterium]
AYSLAFETTAQLQTLINQISKSTAQIKIYAQKSNIHPYTFSELESLILEITLIKKYNPKYNILLKDDKSYPYIELTNEDYPRLRIIHNINRKKNKNHLFGPYPNVTSARKTVNIINRLYPLRKCDHLKKDVCLYYHIHECLGYCVKKIPQETLKPMLKEITSFLKGDAKIVREKIVLDMEEASLKMNYEKAIELKQMLLDIDITLKKQKLSLQTREDFDLFNFYKDEFYLSIQVFYIREGLLFGRCSHILEIVDDVSEEMMTYIINFYQKNNLLPKKIVVPNGIDTSLLENYLDTKVVTPKRGDIKDLLLLALENAKEGLYLKEENLKRDLDNRMLAKEELERILGITDATRIEAYDNSHLFGTFYVGGMVVFDDFLKNKNEYRKFKINTETIDDLGAMKEVVYRRYYRSLMDNSPLPNVILVDGGLLQINVVKEVLVSLNLDIPLIGLVKDTHHRTNSIIDKDGKKLDVSLNSPLFLLLARIQEEVHRFAISYHRTLKSHGMMESVLDAVSGIGEKKKIKLLKKYGSLKKIKEADITELGSLIGKKEASTLISYLEEREEDNNEKNK